jgi:hypothetical protein
VYFCTSSNVSAKESSAEKSGDFSAKKTTYVYILFIYMYIYYVYNVCVCVCVYIYTYIDYICNVYLYVYTRSLETCEEGQYLYVGTSKVRKLRSTWQQRIWKRPLVCAHRLFNGRRVGAGAPRRRGGKRRRRRHSIAEGCERLRAGVLLLLIVVVQHLCRGKGVGFPAF